MYGFAGVRWFCLYLLIAVVCCAQLGYITPTDPYITAGNDLQLTCSLSGYNSSLYNSSSLYFKIVTASPPYIFPSDYYSTPDARTLELRVGNVSKEYSGTYRCYMNDSVSGTSIAATVVTVGAPPGPVKDFSVVSDNFENMTVSWLKSGELVNYSLNWSMWPPGPGPLVMEGDTCYNWHDGVSRVPECIFCGTAASGPCVGVQVNFMKYMRYLVVVKATSPYGNSTGSHEFIANENIVKPRPVSSLTGQSVSSTQLKVSWATPVNLYISVTYQLTYYGDWDSENRTVSTGKNTSADLLSLTPNTDYRLWVRCRPLDKNGTAVGYWSDYKAIVLTTLQDVPAAAPYIAPGSYRVSECSTSKPNCNSVTVYWQEIEKAKQNGNITKYELSVIGTNGANDETNQTLTVEGTKYSGKVELDNRYSYKIVIKPFTIVGSSQNVSTLDLPQGFNNLPVLTNSDVYVEQSPDGSGVFFNWTAFSTKQLKNTSAAVAASYTIFYCPGQKDRAECSGSPLYRTLPGNETNCSLNLSSFESYVFSISANYDIGSAGLTSDWLCIYSYYGTPPRPSLLEPRTQESSVTVRWMEQSCPVVSNVGRVLEYRLWWKNKNFAENKGGNGTEVIVHGNEYTIQGLTPATEYNISLTAISRTGPGPAANQTISTSSPLNIVGIVIGCVLGVLALIATIVVIIYCGWRRKSKDMEERTKPLAITFPPERIYDAEKIQDGNCDDYVNSSGYKYTTESSFVNGSLQMLQNGSNGVVNSNREDSDPHFSIVNETSGHVNQGIDSNFGSQLANVSDSNGLAAAAPTSNNATTGAASTNAFNANSKASVNSSGEVKLSPTAAFYSKQPNSAENSAAQTLNSSNKPPEVNSFHTPSPNSNERSSIPARNGSLRERRVFTGYLPPDNSIPPPLPVNSPPHLPPALEFGYPPPVPNLSPPLSPDPPPLPQSKPPSASIDFINSEENISRSSPSADDSLHDYEGVGNVDRDENFVNSGSTEGYRTVVFGSQPDVYSGPFAGSNGSGQVNSAYNQVEDNLGSARELESNSRLNTLPENSRQLNNQTENPRLNTLIENSQNLSPDFNTPNSTQNSISTANVTSDENEFSTSDRGTPYLNSGANDYSQIEIVENSEHGSDYNSSRTDSYNDVSSEEDVDDGYKSVKLKEEELDSVSNDIPIN